MSRPQTGHVRQRKSGLWEGQYVYQKEHRSRHTFATEALQKTTDIITVSMFKDGRGRLGSRRIQMLLHRKGIEVGKRKVSKLMKQMGLSTNQSTTIYYSPTCMSHMEEVDDVKIL